MMESTTHLHAFRKEKVLGTACVERRWQQGRDSFRISFKSWSWERGVEAGEWVSASGAPDSIRLLEFPFPLCQHSTILLYLPGYRVYSQSLRTSGAQLHEWKAKCFNQYLTLTSIKTVLAYFAFRTSSCAWELLWVPSTDIASSTGNLLHCERVTKVTEWTHSCLPAFHSPMNQGVVGQQDSWAAHPSRQLFFCLSFYSVSSAEPSFEWSGSATNKTDLNWLFHCTELQSHSEKLAVELLYFLVV